MKQVDKICEEEDYDSTSELLPESHKNKNNINLSKSNLETSESKTTANKTNVIDNCDRAKQWKQIEKTLQL